jgi:hypothetical protein
MHMNTSELLELMEYDKSPSFLRGAHLQEYPSYAHIFRLAQKHCRLQGVYTLRDQSGENSLNKSITPTVYVCEADSEQKAAQIHKLVWNQNVVPFLLVTTPKSFRLYNGFKYEVPKEGDKRRDQHILEVVRNAANVLETFADFTATSINSGHVFKAWSKLIKPSTRLDWQLLKSLRNLSEILRERGPELSRNHAHTLIGKYIYLRYLRDRNILSDKKLNGWGLSYDKVFGHNATLKDLYLVENELESWLNGSVFPLPETGLKQEHVRRVTSTFLGDEPASGQMHLGFQAYDFEHIPIETLSVVYEQFLHAEGEGREKGAYYTPMHLVNFILDELEEKRPLEKGMKVFDASCGSGSFLVQCYRRLIERELALRQQKEIRPSELRGLLVKHIFGLDSDEDACGVSELSLIITLLDYVDPPDLSKNTNFKLPELHNKNIFFCNRGFFDPDSEWERVKPKDGYDWIVGNPPWGELSSGTLRKSRSDRERHARDTLTVTWMNYNQKEYPVGRRQVAEAFAWKVTQSLGSQGVIGLLMPATTLFKKTARKFRSKFFKKMNVWCVVNFANLRHLLFRGAHGPAAAFFYSSAWVDQATGETSIVTYAPFAVDQLVRYEDRTVNARDRLWTVIVNNCEIKEISHFEVASGSILPWKLAMWGSVRDKHLLSSVAKRFPSLKQFAKEHDIKILEGFQLRKFGTDKPQNLEFIAELVDKRELDMEALRGRKYVFAIPINALRPIDSIHAYIRKRGGKAPLEICRPPHIIVDAARRFALFSMKFIVVPPRQIGIAGGKPNTNLLKALALYLNSYFVRYHQYLASSFWGIERDILNMDDLKSLPVPLSNLTANEISKWAEFLDKLVALSTKLPENNNDTFFDVNEKRPNSISTLLDLLERINKTVNNALGMSVADRCLIDDLLQVRMKLNEGNIAEEATKPATQLEMETYAKLLKSELDSFLDNGAGTDQHQVTVYSGDDSGIIEILHVEGHKIEPPKVVMVDSQKGRQLTRLSKHLQKVQGQWIYFNRGLRIFEGRNTYLFKPRQRLCWLKSQALIDADEFLGEKLTT